MTSYDVTVERTCVYRTTLRVRADGPRDAFVKGQELAECEDAHGWTALWQDDVKALSVIPAYQEE